MRGVLNAGPTLPIEVWRELRTRAIFDYCKWDHQSGDHSVLARFPLFVESREVELLGVMAEALSAEALAAGKELLRKPELIRRLAIPRKIAGVFEVASDGDLEHRTVRVMRFDFHFTTEGWRISEVNADVPGGFVEASGWNRLLSTEFSGTTAPRNPTQEYVGAIRDLVSPGSLIGLVHATVYSDDRQTMMHFAREMTRIGLRPCLISANHLRWRNRRAVLCSDFANGTPEMIIRFLPAEWLPQTTSTESWEPWFAGSDTLLSNPGSAILLQSKRFPLVWSELSTNLKTWRMLLPESRCPSTVGNLDADEWVLKPALGRVGEGVGMSGVTGQPEFNEIQRAAKKNPENWVAQRRFEIVPVETNEGPVYPCVGVYTVNGKMAGLYGRVGRTPLINETAQDAGILIQGRNNETKQ